MLIFILVAQILCYGVHGEHWSYQHQEKWPQSCKGDFQSPMKLTLKGTNRSNFEQLHFDANTYKRQSATVTNNGHSIVVRFTNNSHPPVVSGGGLEGQYVLDSFHFHWPSEHIVDGFKYKIEGHFVYYSKKVQNLATALATPNAVAVLGVMYNIGLTSNPAFSFVTEIAAVAHKTNKPTPLSSLVSLRNFLPTNLGKFYRYKGSLTTPDCNEVVIWTVFPTPLYVSPKQMRSLTNICDEEDRPIEANNRKVQPLKKRVVYFNG